jgi:hypothetical protein
VSERYTRIKLARAKGASGRARARSAVEECTRKHQRPQFALAITLGELSTAWAHRSADETVDFFYGFLVESGPTLGR